MYLVIIEWPTLYDLSLSISIKTTAFMFKVTVYNYWRDANNYQKEKKKRLFYKIIYFSVQFSAIVNRFIVKT